MCLAVPGKVISIDDGDALTRTARVDFGGVARDVSLAFLPEAGVGDYVLVHAGVGISRLRDSHARRVRAEVDGALRGDGATEES